MSVENTHKQRRYGKLRKIISIIDLSYTHLFILWAVLALIFGVLYFLISTINPAHGPSTIQLLSPADKFLNCLYFSVITATSTGYGDITPLGFSKVLASLQSMSALFVFAVFVTKLVSHRQVLALQEVHKLTFEDIFHNTREDLYVIRSDFDRIIETAEAGKELSERAWLNMKTGYQQLQTLIGEIPEFYDEGNHFYTIDRKREQLLVEGVHRTFHRINEMLDVLSKAGIDWVAREDSVSELRELINVVNRVTPLWNERSPYQKNEAFEDILHLKDSVHTRIEDALPI